MPRYRSTALVVGSLPARFWAKVEKTDYCWLWTAGKTADGYGSFRIGSKRDGTSRAELAHRLAYAEAHGPLPPGLDVDHLCRNHACVRPSHLDAVPHRENLLRGDTITARNAAVTHCPHGHEYTPENTRIGKRGARFCRACQKAWDDARPRVRSAA